jgi:hypothetical protein
MPVSKNLDASVVGYNGQSSAFYGVVRNAKITISDVAVTTPMFVAEKHDPEYTVILGRPFQRSGRMSMWNDDEGACHGILYDEERNHSVEFQAVGVVHPANKGADQFIGRVKALN